MKTKISILIIVLSFMSGAVFAQSPLSKDTPFKDWYKNTSIETTYVTKSMWDLVPNLKIGNKDVAELQDMLEQVEIYASPKKNGWSYDALMRMAISKAEENNYELIMQLGNDSKQVIFYTKKDGKNKNVFKDLILINTENTSLVDGKCSVIRLLGSFTIEDIQDLITIPKPAK